MKNRSVVGEKYKFLTITSERREVSKCNGGKYYKYVVDTLCVCGNKVPLQYERIRLGLIISCGCKNQAAGQKQKNSMPCRSREYRSWKSMIERCVNEKDRNYQRYGDRGIKVCERWLNSFESFIKDMGKCPSSIHTLDRKNNNKGYYKRNCRWATPKQQANNRRTNRLITINNVTKTLTEWAEYYGINYERVWARLKLGWTIEEAFSIPVLSGIHKHKYLNKNETKKQAVLQ